MSVYSVAVDGPSGAGKSTLSKAVAKELGIVYVDTGAIYRSIGYYIYKNGMDPKDAAAVVAVLPQIRVDMRYSDDGLQHMLLNGRGRNGADPAAGDLHVCLRCIRYPGGAYLLLEMQRDMARRSSVIMDGGISAPWLPQAQVKIFLSADVEVRARRRTMELEQRGTPKPYEQVLEEMKARDWADSHRAAAPLQAAADAVTVDTTHMDFQQSMNAILQEVRKRVR